MEEPNLVQEFPPEAKKTDWKGILVPSLVILAIIVAGAVTGYFLSKRGGFASRPTESRQLTGGAELIQGPNEIGIKDEAAFKDTAQGKIEINDNGDIVEGSHKLLRPGGPSQTAYLTSSVLDLNQFKGKCVQVWGETFASQKAGWLMDVGRIKILEVCPEGL
ncbi:hypothetical protein COY29_00165 [Candidatus Woesebacteria bacterium CG_4_10_14_0_2_um_filter_39_14]|uniref:Uncharacterized protein n=3 Tax=Microgenomates group TaxID=1794810 RepID=A0A2M6YPN4_9BACT|nr:MAG: hypothetical protein COT04_02010 [Candidatus Shapirobacteria bacterium CG07_land_8_20_14_0_80_39_12]PIZ50260.1 MAG: hypothetical protein COY29_00165 [Candidatus Woesebacteria bacterium CG_4_10_14_0_2_um_filter_39_14]PJA50071.1 MAG: hypothetical protein CO169_00185 [Candidatus Shapirobacteria bacterium CG_4_9_14_3_um_filter_39_13]